ncbi:Spy/CpxP family protein refolding chaperone [Methylocapsa acidiphila]|uniref:Spy/CpxP family protein refolding chaperone n=1 Tax=Methylocapsa acidiphila TaxID=133552 RepID=UPI0004172D22|nr:Spy/CpxP family protein refolding chaperone [Methylocapsa acidiphila]
MKSRLPIVLILTALAGGAAVAVESAGAQQPPPPPPPLGAPVPPPGPERHAPPHWAFSPVDLAAFADAHIAALHAGLKLTPEQEKLWPPVEAALRAGAKGALERHEKIRKEAHTDDIIAFLRRLSEGATARGETLKAVADAAAPLYATLTEEQKHRLPFLLHPPHLFGPQFGPHEGPRGGHGGADEIGGFGPLGPPHDFGPHHPDEDED